MGPLIDAKDTPFFTFDDRAEFSKEKRDNDLLLLRAPYESGTAPGDDPEKAIAHFESFCPSSEKVVSPTGFEPVTH